MKTFLISLLILTFTSIFAQNHKLKWGPEEKGERSYGAIDQLGWNQGSFYTIQSRVNNIGKRKFYLEKIDENLKLVYSKKLETKNYGPSHAKIIENQIYYFQIRNKGLSMKEAEFYYNIYDLNGNFIKEVIVKTIEGLNKWSQIGGYRIYGSTKGDKIGFTLSEDNLKDGYLRLLNGVMDISDLNEVKVTSKTISVSEDAKQSLLYDAEITSNGSIVNILGYRDDYDAPYLYNLVTLKKDGKYSEPIPLKFEDDLYFDQIELKPIGSDKFIFTGFYLTEEKRKNLVKGFFIATFNTNTNEIETFSDFPYTEEFFKSLGYKIKNNGRVKFSGGFNLEIIMNNKSGSGYLIADHEYMDSRFKIKAEAIILPFDSTGKLGDQMVLPKKQSSSIGTLSTIGGSGYFAFCKNDKLYILYNGSSKNINILDLDDLKAEKSLDRKHSATIIATIEKSGELKREILFTYKERDGYLIPNKCSIKDDKILISINDKKKVRYGILELN